MTNPEVVIRVYILVVVPSVNRQQDQTVDNTVPKRRTNRIRRVVTIDTNEGFIVADETSSTHKTTVLVKLFSLPFFTFVDKEVRTKTTPTATGYHKDYPNENQNRK